MPNLTKAEQEAMSVLNPPPKIAENIRAFHAASNRETVNRGLLQVQAELSNLLSLTHGFTAIKDNAGVPGKDYGAKKEYIATKLAERIALNERSQKLDEEAREAAAEQAAAENLPGFAVEDRKRIAAAVPLLQASHGNPYGALAKHFHARLADAGAGNLASFNTNVSLHIDTVDAFGSLAFDDRIFRGPNDYVQATLLGAGRSLQNQQGGGGGPRLQNAGELLSTGATTGGYAQLDVNIPLLTDEVPKRRAFFGGMLPAIDVEGGKIVAYRARTAPSTEIQMKGKKEAAKRSGAPDGADQPGYSFAEWYVKGEKKTVTVQMRGGIVKLSLEELYDEPQLTAELRMLMGEDLDRDVDDQIVNGDGAAPNLEGLFDVAARGHVSLTDKKVAKFTALGLTAAADDKIYGIEVLWAMLDSILLDGRTMANFVLMHPRDVTETLRTKDDDGRFVFDNALRSQAGTGETATSISLGLGVPVYKSDVVAKGKVAAGNTNYISLVRAGGVSFDIGMTGDDFAQGNVSMRIYRRYVPLWHRPKSIYTIDAGYAGLIKAVA